MDTYTYAGTLLWQHPEDDELDIEIEVEAVYGVERGYAAIGPTYASGGEPGQPDGIIDVEIVKIDGKTWAQIAPTLPFGLTPAIADGALADKLVRENHDQMIEAADDADEPDWDARREDREENARYWAERDWGNDYD